MSAAIDSNYPVDPTRLDSAQFVKAVASGAIDLGTIDPATLSPEQREELEKQGVIPGAGGSDFVNVDNPVSPSQAMHKGKGVAKEEALGFDESAESSQDPDHVVPKEAANQPTEAILAGPGEGTSASDSFQRFLDEKALDANFEGYHSSDKAATIEAIKATYGQDADFNDIAATARKDMAAADKKMESLGIDSRTVAADAIVVSTQKASPTAMGSHIMNKSKALDLFGLTDKAELAMSDVNKAFKAAMREPGADRSALMNARSLLRADLSAQGASTQPTPEPGSSPNI